MPDYVPGIAINGKPVTREEYNSGAWLRALQQSSDRPNAFTPWSPPPIPSGYYDPSLDASRDSASRGLLNTEQDVGLGLRRAGEDYQTAKDTTTRGYDRQFADINEGKRYTEEDYTRNVGLLSRQYGQLGRQQAEQSRKYGVTSGGIALMSAAKRAENEGIDRSALSTARDRTLTGYDTTAGRLQEDRTADLSGLSRSYDRSVADGGTALSRARSEDMFFGLDTGQQKLFQAQQAGYAAPTGPSNEFRRPDGTVVRTVKRGGYVYVYDQNGREISKRRAA